MSFGNIHIFAISLVLWALPLSAVARSPLVSALNAPVRMDDVGLRGAAETRFVGELAALGLRGSGPHGHWIEDVSLNEYGELITVLMSSRMAGVDASGAEKDVLCEALWQRSGGIWNFKSNVGSPTSCTVLAALHPSRQWSFITQDWFPHSGSVDRKSFERLYGRFNEHLKDMAVFSPSWTRDAWILKTAVDSDLRVRRVWIFASALLDRLSLSVEKRADCHGESYWNEISGWGNPSSVQCRIQVYRYVKSCFSTSNCVWEWVPCEGDACFETVPE